MKNQKIAIILFNLGAPDSLDAVRPFLFNLFSDKHILRLPFLFRLFLAFVISTGRAKKSSEIYKILGGKSPLLENTEKQARALENLLENSSQNYQIFKSFIVMRYWHPMSEQIVHQVKSWNPNKILLLPLYPQFSSTTTQSSFHQWDNSARKIALDKPTYRLCCYPQNHGFITSIAKFLENALKNIKDKENWRVLFSAHGLPEKIIKSGDPYQWQIEQSAVAVAAKVKNIPEWRICYQSRVGPMEWIKPYTEAEIILAGEQGKSIILVPIAFISEHSETLVELDHEYSELARAKGVKNYVRIQTVSEDKKFILGLKSEIENMLKTQNPIDCSEENTICPKKFSDCPYRKA